MKHSTTILLLAALVLMFATAGCMHWRVFQAKVPTNTEKPAAQAEGEKQAAQYINNITTPPVADPVATVASVHEIAGALSASLGQPATPVNGQDQIKIIAALRNGLLEKDKQLEGWKAYGRKYSGKTIEGTGFDLGPFLGVGGLLGVVALCIFVPGVGFVVLRVVPVLWGMVRRMATGIEAFAVAQPEQASNLKQNFLQKTMNEIDKKIVDKKKKKIKRSVVEDLARAAPA